MGIVLELSIVNSRGIKLLHFKKANIDREGHTRYEDQPVSRKPSQNLIVRMLLFLSRLERRERYEDRRERRQERIEERIERREDREMDLHLRHLERLGYDPRGQRWCSVQ